MAFNHPRGYSSTAPQPPRLSGAVDSRKPEPGVGGWSRIRVIFKVKIQLKGRRKRGFLLRVHVN